MTTLRQEPGFDANRSTRIVQGAVQIGACETLGGHIRISSAGGAQATGTSCWRCGAGLSNDSGVRVVGSIAAAQAQDTADRR